MHMDKKGKKGNSENTEAKIDDNREISIGQLVKAASKITGQHCTPAMIYNYEKKGLLPRPSRTEGGFRLFRIKDIQTVVCIKQLQGQGRSLEEIKEKVKGCTLNSVLTDEDLGLPVDRRAQILNAATEIFLQKGYAATTLNDIALGAGINYSAIYQQFESKEKLFLALIDQLSFFPLMIEIMETLDAKNDDSLEDIRRSLIRVGEKWLKNHQEGTEIVRMFFAETRNTPELGRQYTSRLIAPTEKLMTRYLSAQIRRGLLRPVDIELAVHAFFGMLAHFHIVENLLGSDKVMKLHKKDRVAKIVDIFLGGLSIPDTDSKRST